MYRVEPSGNDNVADLSWRYTASSRENPVCYLVDREPGVRELVSALLKDCRIGVETFDSPAELTASDRRDPDLVMVDITTSASDALAIIEALAGRGLRCPVQVLSGLSPMLIEQVRRHGERCGLQMLPVAQKPLQSNALLRTITQLGLRRDPLGMVETSLEEVLAEDWLEVWYQPMINLKHRNLVGAEAFVRARHPEHGILPPEIFLVGASERSLLDLTQRVLTQSLQDWPAFATIGAPIELSINVPVVALSKLSIFGIMWEQKPDTPQWPGLVLEISEEEAAGNVTLLRKATAELRSYGIGIAIDNFGPRYSEFMRLSEVPFTAVKIDRSYVANCDTDPVNRSLSETIIEFADRYQLTSAAEGVETAAELKTLREIGCDIGQGYLFARPQPKDELISLLQRRAKVSTAA